MKRHIVIIGADSFDLIAILANMGYRITTGVYSPSRDNVLYTLELRDHQLGYFVSLVADALDGFAAAIHGKSGNAATEIIRRRRDLLELYASGDYEGVRIAAINMIREYHWLHETHTAVAMNDNPHDAEE